MADTHHAQGPGKSVLGIGQRIVSIMVEMVETRLRLAVVELEEEKANLFQLLLMLDQHIRMANRPDRHHATANQRPGAQT